MEFSTLLGVGEILELLNLEFSVLLDKSEYGERIVLEGISISGRAHS